MKGPEGPELQSLDGVFLSGNFVSVAFCESASRVMSVALSKLSRRFRSEVSMRFSPKLSQRARMVGRGG